MGLSASVVKAFAFDGEFASAEHLPGGHINPSWRITTAGPGGCNAYLLQQVNASVFVEPRTVMRNLRALLDFLRERLDGESQALPAQQRICLIPTRDGSDWLEVSDGTIWRAFPMIPSAVREVALDAADARAAGFAFGTFLRLLASYNGPSIGETVAHFHDTAWHLEALDRAAMDDAHGRAHGVSGELAVCRAVRSLPAELALAGRRRRLVHNDAKLANLLFDPAGARPIAVIDLDTVMPGSPLQDAGDLIRSMASRAREDEPDLKLAQADPGMVLAVLDGWFQGAAELLSDDERAAAVLAGCVITLEQAARFLTDYLVGDVYYQCDDPDQNLRRARTQLSLLTSLLHHRASLERDAGRLTLAGS